MRLKIGIGVIFVLLLAATFLMYRLWQEEKKESARLSDNMKSLCTGLEEYKIRDSLNVVAVSYTHLTLPTNSLV